MFNKDTNKATNCPRAVLEAFSGESKDQGQFIRAICNYAQNDLFSASRGSFLWTLPRP